MTQPELTKYFRNEFMQKIKSNLARIIKESNKEILGICSEQDILAENLFPVLQAPLDDYGIRIVAFTIAALDIPENDPNRQKLEAAYALKRENTIWGDDSNRFFARQLLTDIANNPGSGGLANMGAGIGMGMGIAPMIGNMNQQAFAPVQQSIQQQPVHPQQPSSSGRFIQKSAVPNSSEKTSCPSCGAKNIQGAKFCNECGAKIIAEKVFCVNCGSEIPATAKFCNECGTKRM